MADISQRAVTSAQADTGALFWPCIFLDDYMFFGHIEPVVSGYFSKTFLLLTILIPYEPFFTAYSASFFASYRARM